jgi:hypothetical protein
LTLDLNQNNAAKPEARAVAMDEAVIAMCRVIPDYRARLSSMKSYNLGMSFKGIVRFAVPIVVAVTGWFVAPIIKSKMDGTPLNGLPGTTVARILPRSTRLSGGFPPNLLDGWNLLASSKKHRHPA